MFHHPSSSLPNPRRQPDPENRKEERRKELTVLTSAMVDQKDYSEKEEKKIPVFTVLKKGSILKNIFLLDNPPQIFEPESIEYGGENSSQEKEEILLVGRHPDCNIMLEHPSISRFHLRIHSQPSSQKLSVVDLSSAHGTWVSERKIEPQVQVELSEGDTLRLGVSTRIYRLHWFPLSRAFDVENSLLPPILENPLPPEEEGEETYENENLVSFVREQIPSAPPMPENINSLFSDDEEEVLSVDEMLEEKENQNPSRRLEQSDVQSLWSEPLAAESVNSSALPVERVPGQQIDRENQNPEALFGADVLSERENQESPPRMETKCDVPSLWSRRGKPASLLQIQTGRSKGKILGVDVSAGIEAENQNEIKDETVSRVLFSSLDGEEEIFTPDKENFTPETVLGLKSMKKGRVEEIKHLKSSRSLSLKVPKFGVNVGIEAEKQNEMVPTVLFCGLDGEEELFTPDKENFNPKTVLGLKSMKKGRVEEIKHSKSSGSLSLKFAKFGVNVGIEAEKQNEIKDEMVPKVLFCGLDGEEELFTPDKENFNPKTVLGLKSMKKGRVEEIKHSKSSGSLSSKFAKFGVNVGIEAEKQNEIKDEMVPKVLFCGLDEEEELFTPDKENFNPKTVLGLKSMKKGRVEERNHPKSSGSLSSKVTINLNFNQEEGTFFSSEKENLTPIVLQDSKSKKPTFRSRERLESEMVILNRREGRVPFHSLLPNSIGKSMSEVSVPNATSRSSSSVHCGQSMEKNRIHFSNQSVGDAKMWNMVVDTSCLLNKESMKSLKLLQGIKGTRLIIPKMVIRELDCLKRRSSLFRRETEVSSVLQWIEECMVKTKWWIHVQSSVEEVMPIAPTPPASPLSRLSEESNGVFGSSVPFSTCGSLMEIVSPTAEDHILECAILFKKIKNYDQLVLLTNDVALKIKAMAEGLICETAEEFRESLVNPYSERFLWVESTPRGPTWSCSDGAGLRENYNHFPIKKTSKASEGAKGLKLILLHNSHYRQTKSVN